MFIERSHLKREKKRLLSQTLASDEPPALTSLCTLSLITEALGDHWTLLCILGS